MKKLGLQNLLNVGQRVTVQQLVDDTAETKYLNKKGHIVNKNGNGQTGNSKTNPLYDVRFPDGHIESYWREELKTVN